MSSMCFISFRTTNRSAEGCLHPIVHDHFYYSDSGTPSKLVKNNKKSEMERTQRVQYVVTR